MSVFWALAAALFLIGMNAFFVAGEYAVVAVRPSQIEGMRKRGRRGTANAIARLKANPASAIGTIQVCITMTNLMLGWIGEPAMSAVLRVPFGPLIERWPGVFLLVSTALSFVIVTLVTVVFSELLPKALTLRYVEPAAVLTAVPMAAVQRAVRPVVWLMNKMADAVTRPLGLGSVDDMEKQQVSVDELRMMAMQAGDDGVVTPRERAVILNALAMGRRTARQIMVPRLRVQFLDTRRSMAENREAINSYLYSRLPLCTGGLDHVVGVVQVKEFLTAYHEAGDTSVLGLIAHPPVFVPEGATLDRLLTTLHEKRSQLLFVVDEYGGVEGIVTLQDVIDELVGEAEDAPAQVQVPVTPPSDRAAAAAMPAAAGDAAENGADHASPMTELELPGETPLHELARRLNLPEWDAPPGVATLGGLIVARLSHIPAVGETIEVGGAQFRVLASDRRAVRRVRVTILPPSEPADDLSPDDVMSNLA